VLGHAIFEVIGDPDIQTFRFTLVRI